ncbi:nonstructural protein [Blackfly microvirus SF02]|uniref:Nonstructural protein n=1 Tax=Blackfly microvirus SF02 TaxID=2576452 RepID=A0A4P8PKG7_9VIRU|nr:nonstructural protein [Blackfly microvirus SF02]
MKIYAVRDRLIDYFQQPFAAPGDKEVLTAISAAVNTEGNDNAIAQAPHHYEVWRLGEVDDQGHINASKEFLADVSSLVRRNIRRAEEGEPGAGTLAEAVRRLRGAAEAPGGGTHPTAGTAAHAAQAAAGARTETPGADKGGHPELKS